MDVWQGSKYTSEFHGFNNALVFLLKVCTFSQRQRVFWSTLAAKIFKESVRFSCVLTGKSAKRWTRAPVLLLNIIQRSTQKKIVDYVYQTLVQVWICLLLTLLSCPPNIFSQNVVIFFKGKKSTPEVFFF